MTIRPQPFCKYVNIFHQWAWGKTHLCWTHVSGHAFSQPNAFGKNPETTSHELITSFRRGKINDF